jgi:putative hydrolase of the HAD superfamily
MTRMDANGFWDGIETVFFDAGGVFLHPDWARVSAVLAARGIALAPERLAQADTRARHDIDTAEQIRASDDAGRWLRYFELTLRAAGWPDAAAPAAALEALRAEHRRASLWTLVSPDAVTALARLAARGLRRVVVSNGDGRLRRLSAELGLAACFDLIVDSGEVGLEKPDPRVFQLALERSGAAPGSTVHVGDLYHVDVLGARGAGLRAALMDPADLYVGADCPRVRSLTELADRLAPVSAG